MPLRDFRPGAEPAHAQPETPADDDILGRPALVAGGTRYYTIGALAAALNRSTVTIREWHRLRVIPNAYITNADSRNGRRRLYTEQMILQLRQLAADCEVLDNPRAPIIGSEFSRLSFVLWNKLKEAA